jgi:choline dehydrogenase-like flavoprotein
MSEEYDVVIVGTGVAGSVLARVLTNAGKRVCILEAGLHDGVSVDSQHAYATYMGYLDTYYAAAAKTPNAPYPNLDNAPSADVLKLEPIVSGKPSTKGYLVQMGPIPFGSDNARTPGGTTLHWLGTTLRMLPNDFRMKTAYGVGVDWPFSYDDLRPYYEMAELEIGVSGEVEDQKDLPVDEEMYPQGYVYPMEKIPESYLDKVLTNKIVEGPPGKKTKRTVVMNGDPYELTCISTPQGRNSVPNADYPWKGTRWNADTKRLDLVPLDEGKTYEPVGAVWDEHTGQRCEGNASCVPICPVQAKYNALKSLQRCDKSNLTIITQAVASRVIVHPVSKRISEIEYKKYRDSTSSDHEVCTIRGRVFVLAASAIENAKILLASGAANRSDQVGRNLMDHMTVLRWGLTKEPVYPMRGPGSTTNLATFRDGEFRKTHAAWIAPLDNWGWQWPMFSPGPDVSGLVTRQDLFGKKLRDAVREKITRQFLIHFECEQAPDPECRVTIRDEYKDRLGNHRPVIHYRATEYMLRAFEAATEVSAQLFRMCEVEDRTEHNPEENPQYVRHNGIGYRIDGAGHIVGTHRCGSDPDHSVTDPDMRTWDHANLFLAGCGNMPTLGTSNPTLTMTAMTFKAAEAILRQLEP